MDLEGVIGSVVEAAGLELVEVGFTSRSGRRVLRVTVDREGGVDLDTIAETSARIGRRLDLEGFEPGPYELEVSSPGVERPLKTPSDFARRIGERVKVKVSRSVEGSRTVSGAVVGAGTAEVTIATADGERAVRYDDIVSARTVFEWGPASGSTKRV
ncbi:MAG TPA: ribosome maturation factor RimP [Actinomycetota bacterium]|nr:ribosome maturation factor RimP [Actinomycetota bacterium]